MAIIRDSMIGGATVARYFQHGSEAMKPGTTMTREALLAIPRPNLQALVDTGKIALIPPVQGMLPGESPELHLMSRGFGKYDVLQGRILNEETFTSKEDAEAFIKDLEAKAEQLPGEAAPEPATPETPAPN